MQTVWLQRQEEQMLYSTATFRHLLDCAARPGKIASLTAPTFLGEPPVFYSATAQAEVTVNFYALGLLLALLDGEVSFAVVADGKLLENSSPAVQWLARRSGAKPVGPEQANFVLCCDGDSGELLNRVSQGSLLEPESSATAIYTVEELATEPQISAGKTGGRLLELSGPGILDSRLLYVAGLGQAEIELIKATRSNYPLGVDVFLVDTAGRCVGLPRTTKIRQV